MSRALALPSVKLERVAPGVHRVDVACPLLGLSPPTTVIDLHLHRLNGSWSVRASGADGEAIRRWLSSVLGVATARMQRTGTLRTLVGTTRSPPQRLVQAMARGRIEQLRVTPEGTSFLLYGPQEAVQAMGMLLRKGPAASLEARLTPRQEELLQHCVARGYYAIPRHVTLRQLATELGISTTSLSLALRRAEARIVLAYSAHAVGALPAEADRPAK